MINKLFEGAPIGNDNAAKDHRGTINHPSLVANKISKLARNADEHLRAADLHLEAMFEAQKAKKRGIRAGDKVLKKANLKGIIDYHKKMSDAHEKHALSGSASEPFKSSLKNPFTNLKEVNNRFGESLSQKLFLQETAPGEYDETKHDRDESGKFSSGGGSSGSERKAGASVPGNPSSSTISSEPSRPVSDSSNKFHRKETYALGASNKAFEHSGNARKIDPADAKAHAEHHRKAFALHKHAASELRSEGRNKAADEHEALAKIHKGMHEHNAKVSKHSDRISILANKVSSAAIKVNSPKAHKIASRIAKKAGATKLAVAHKKIADLKTKKKEDDYSPYNPTEKEHKKFSKFASKLAKTARKKNEERGIFVRPKTKESQDMNTISSKLFLSEGAPIGNTNAAKDHSSGEEKVDSVSSNKVIVAKSLGNRVDNYSGSGFSHVHAGTPREAKRIRMRLQRLGFKVEHKNLAHEGGAENALRVHHKLNKDL